MRDFKRITLEELKQNLKDQGIDPNLFTYTHINKENTSENLANTFQEIASKEGEFKDDTF